MSDMDDKAETERDARATSVWDRDLTDCEQAALKSSLACEGGIVEGLIRRRGVDSLKLLAEVKSAKLVDMIMENDGEEGLLGLSSGAVVSFDSVEYLGNGWLSFDNVAIIGSEHGEVDYRRDMRKLENGLDVAIKDVVWVASDPFGRERMGRMALRREIERRAGAVK
jgi:hypothetical protein